MATGSRFTKIATYNIHRAFGRDGKFDPDRIAGVIRSLDAGVVALQEVDSSLRTESGEDLLSYLARATQSRAVMGPTLSFAYGQYGNAFLFRTPVSRVFETDLSVRRREPRGALTAETRWGSQRWHICCAHLGLRRGERALQIKTLLEAMPWNSGMAIALLGDFNEWWPWSASLSKLRRCFPADKRETRAQPTFPTHWPRLALDRIFLHPEPRGIRRWTPTDPASRIASDHLPLVAEFADPIESI